MKSILCVGNRSFDNFSHFLASVPDPDPLRTRADPDPQPTMLWMISEGAASPSFFTVHYKIENTAPKVHVCHFISSY